MRIVFFGTPSFAVHILERLVKEGVDVVAVITQPDRPKGRNLHLQPLPVKEWLLKHDSSIPCFQPEKVSTPEMAQIISSFKPDLFLVVGYGEILKDFILEIPKIEAINIHTSLLPKYRGAAPIQRAILAGETTLGVTIMKMVKKMDAGDYCAQRGGVFSEKMNFAEIEKILASIAADLIIEVLPKIFNQTISFHPQEESEVTFAPKILSEDLMIDWDKPARSILNQIREFSPAPGAQCLVKIKDQTKSLKILSASLSSHKALPRELVALTKSNFVLGCLEDSLQLHEVKLEGKSVTTFDALIRGYPQLQFL